MSPSNEVASNQDHDLTIVLEPEGVTNLQAAMQLVADSTGQSHAVVKAMVSAKQQEMEDKRKADQYYWDMRRRIQEDSLRVLRWGF